MRMSRPLLAAVFALPLGVSAQHDPRIAAELELALARLYESGAFDASEGQPVELAREPYARYELDAVVDARASDGGLPVLAVTPGGNGDRLGLRPGDRLLALNQVPLAGAADPVGEFLAAVESSRGSFDLTVGRDGRELQLAGAAEPTQVPGYRIAVTAPPRGCGRIDMSMPPPARQGIHPVILHEVDGRLPGPLAAESFRLSPGRHSLKLSEAIDGRYLTLVQGQRRADLQRHERFKYFELDVEDDTVYRIGARQVKERTSSEDVRTGAYWEPVVWSTANVPCN